MAVKQENTVYSFRRRIEDIVDRAPLLEQAKVIAFALAVFLVFNLLYQVCAHRILWAGCLISEL